ncbi:MAG: helix-turn-helix domain-containing protein [Clostridiales bacterium]|nr:helix-turn-helix domain-containing protein [Clostridiales bacterium]
MAVNDAIYELRMKAKITQEEFAHIFHVSRQAVQKWENGTATPELSKLIEISKYFDISLDEMILQRSDRLMEALDYNAIKPHYATLDDRRFYPAFLEVEYRQSTEEGLDIEAYRDLFEAVARLPKNAFKKKLGDVLFEIVASAKHKEGYPYKEPSDLQSIRLLRKKCDIPLPVDRKTLKDKILGAWLGRIAGCMLGKTVEGIKLDELIPFLKETGNYPMHRYILKKDITDEICAKYRFPFKGRHYADEIDGMPADDDTNYMVLYQLLIDHYGRDFTPYDVSAFWLEAQKLNAYCTAERFAYINFVNGFEPPQTALYQNPYREMIGAQIRGDYFGYINPGDPEKAAEMAWRDASISHIKNGIYGEMYVSAMIAAAASTNHIEAIIERGMAEIPATSRLYEAICWLLNLYRSGVSQKDCFEQIHQKYDDRLRYHWLHTISNAVIVTASLLYGKGDYAKSICMAVEAGFDTDCNGATVGSILGMANGSACIPSIWTQPFRDILHTSVYTLSTVNISERAALTLSHIPTNP